MSSIIASTAIEDNLKVSRFHINLLSLIDDEAASGKPLLEPVTDRPKTRQVHTGMFQCKKAWRNKLIY